MTVGGPRVERAVVTSSQMPTQALSHTARSTDEKLPRRDNEHYAAFRRAIGARFRRHVIWLRLRGLWLKAVISSRVVKLDPVVVACANEVIEGRRAHCDRGFFTAEGRVGERGRVEASIGALGMWASADGQLSDGQGSGVWQFPERGCSGQWVARRSS